MVITRSGSQTPLITEKPPSLPEPIKTNTFAFLACTFPSVDRKSGHETIRKEFKRVIASAGRNERTRNYLI